MKQFVKYKKTKVMKVFGELRDLPKNVSSMMSAARQEMSQTLSQVAQTNKSQVAKKKKKKRQLARLETKVR